MKNPCMGCGKREMGCHAKCEEYKAFWAAREEARKDAALRREAKEFTLYAVRKMKKRANLK